MSHAPNQTPTTKRLAVEELAVSRLFGAAAASAISKTGKSMDEIGAAAGKDGRWLRRVLFRWLDGRPGRSTLRDFASILSACDCEADIRLLPYQEQTP
jgi:hypothetical protein